MTTPVRVSARTPTGIWKTSPISARKTIDEAVVVLRLDQDVELVVVEVLQEVDGPRQRDPVGERDAGDEQHRHHRHQRQRDPPLARVERRQHERVGLPEDNGSTSSSAA